MRLDMKQHSEVAGYTAPGHVEQIAGHGQRAPSKYRGANDTATGVVVEGVSDCSWITIC